jgi:hypothetical protein
VAHNIRIKAIHKKDVDVYSCVLALLALARQLQPETPADDVTPTGDGDE